ncbi:adenylate/guanylate cyclase domain-containing protein [Herpetosiphon giganteus]|uniref:adenylate/guanylate cyclase domain-containing protein n=1 Tax=Herpetosiphon giganteus TaxID=2029754 RepID=UPI00195CD097|nr:adenylate/guanylate cyclase domain-containing protein [Herpetosiphon giganteus]MBM7846161.1 class 3 adenylate cyclase/predicted ATPase [Herpetosiphon giganteus]
MAANPQISSFLPRYVLQRLIDEQQLRQPLAEDQLATVLFADFSGFSRLSEQFAYDQTTILEYISDVLNDSFSQLIDTVIAHGGDVVKFAGDALIAIWMADDLEQLRQTTQLAAQCGLAIQASFTLPSAAERLAIRVQIGAGSISNFIVGGVNNHWEQLISGEALLQVHLLGSQTHAGQVVISPEARSLIREQGQGEDLRAQAFRLTGLVENLPLPEINQSLPNYPTEQLTPFMPTAVIARINAGLHEWLAELRHLSVMFINVPALSFFTTLEQVQAAISALQTVIFRYEGSIDKLSVDDKGVSLLAAFGLPPLSHRDDAERAVRAALEASTALTKLSLTHTIGIATGPAFCGEIGNSQRREFTMIGDVVNRAARLMEANLAPILCDQTTAQASQQQVRFQVLPPIMIKGKSQPITIYRPQQTNYSPDQIRPRRLIGRRRERGQIEQLFTQALPTIQHLMLTGESGMGKSALLYEAVEIAEHYERQALLITSSSLRQSAQYPGWRLLLEACLAVEQWPHQASQCYQLIIQRLQLPDQLAKSVQLLHDVLELPGRAESNATLDQAQQVQIIHELIGHALSQLHQQKPLVLCIDNLQWFDSLALNTLEQLLQQQPEIILITTAPTKLAGLAAQQLLHLQALDPVACIAVVAQSLGVQAIPPSVAAFINQRAAGHPLWSIELAQALRNAGMIRINNGICKLDQFSQLEKLNLPSTIQGVLVSRIDQLPPQPQLTLKIASVIGHEFQVQLLEAIYPLAHEREHIPAHLDLLVQQGFIHEASEGYRFSQAIIHDVAYSLLLFGQRRALHRAIAEWYASEHPHLAEAGSSLLAHHWSHAIDPDEPESRQPAIEALQRAGEQTLLRCSYREAIPFFERALHLLAVDDDFAAQQQIVRMQFNLSQARWRLGDHSMALTNLDSALVTAQRIGDGVGEADVLRQFGNIAYVQGDLYTAQQHFSASVNRARHANYHSGIISGVSNVGVVAFARGDYQVAREAYREGLATSREQGHDFGIAVNQLNLGGLAIVEQAWDEARHYLYEALNLGYTKHMTLVCLHSLVALAEWRLATNQAEASANLIQIVLHHEAIDSEIHAAIDKLKPQLIQILGETQWLILSQRPTTPFEQIIPAIVQELATEQH